jgi:hypothetical protein
VVLFEICYISEKGEGYHPPALILLRLISKLFSLGSANRANSFASAAVEALVSVDNVLAVLFRNSSYGAFAFASAASETFVNINLVCHYSIPP